MRAGTGGLPRVDRQITYSLLGVLSSDKCSAISQFCIATSSANVAVGMATGAADPNRLSQRQERLSGEGRRRAGLRTLPRGPLPCRDKAVSSLRVLED